MQFNYFSPINLLSLKETIYKLEDYVLLAGGTDLLVKMKEKLVSPKNIVDLKNIAELKCISFSEDSYLEIGAMVTHSQLEKSELVKKHADILAQAASQVGSPQIRNVGTVGGNIGNASPAADTVPPLMALNTKVIVQTLEGIEEKDLFEIFAGPGKLKLNGGQVITHMKVAAIKENEGAAFIKQGKRRALAISLINCAVWIKVKEGLIADVRIALGSVAPTPIRLFAVEKWLTGKETQPQVIEAAARMAKDAVKPIDDIRSTAEYRKTMVEVAVLKGLKIALQKAQGGLGSE